MNWGKTLGSAALAAMLALAGCSKSQPAADASRDDYVFEPVRMAAAYLALMEKPDAVRALLIGEAARTLEPVLTHAGVRPTVAHPSGRYDLVIVSCDEMSPESFAKVSERVSDNGVLAWMLDVRGVTFGELERRLAAFASEEAHLWMPGAGHWLLVGRLKSRRVKLSAMLDVFTREGTFEDLAKARAATVPEMFANYVGGREDWQPVFKFNDPDNEVACECFFTKEIPALGWVSCEGLDTDIAKDVLREIHSLQLTRRQVLEGKLLSQTARDKAGEEQAIAKWHTAALRNPRDLVLLERLDRLNRNARGFLALGKVLQAMKCYETMLLIRPTASSVHNFGKCLEKIGKRDVAEQAFRRARELEAQGEVR